jgi:hypothetical protein
LTTNSNDFMSAAAISNLQGLVLQAMISGNAKVLAQRSEEASNLARAHALENHRAPQRAAELIASIPSLVEAETTAWLRRSNPSSQDGFDCGSTLVRLTELESCESVGCLHDPEWTNRRPNPANLRYAARLVFDFLQQAGYNPQLVREVYRLEEFSYDECAGFRIDIRWNIPTELKSIN